MTIHHATLAKAAKLGVTMTENPDTEAYVANWTEKNKRGYIAFGTGAAAALLADMLVWQMIAREYPNLKVAQPYVADENFVWEVSLRKDVIGEGERLNDAFEDALDVISKKNKPLADRIDDGEATDTELAEVAEEQDADDEAIDEMEEEAAEGKSVVKRKYKSRYRPFKMTCGDELSQLITAHVTVTDDEGKHIDRKKLIHFAKRNGAWDERYVHLNNGMARMNVANRIRAKVRKDGYEVIWN